MIYPDKTRHFETIEWGCLGCQQWLASGPVAPWHHHIQPSSHRETGRNSPARKIGWTPDMSAEASRKRPQFGGVGLELLTRVYGKHMGIYGNICGNEYV